MTMAHVEAFLTRDLMEAVRNEARRPAPTRSKDFRTWTPAQLSTESKRLHSLLSNTRERIFLVESELLKREEA